MQCMSLLSKDLHEFKMLYSIKSLFVGHKSQAYVFPLIVAILYLYLRCFSGVQSLSETKLCVADGFFAFFVYSSVQHFQKYFYQGLAH